MKNNGFGVSVRGQFHRKNKMPNQDYFKVVNNDNYTLAIVCDGLGSKKFSHYASKRLCNLAARMVEKLYKTKSLIPEKFLKQLKKKFVKHIFPFNLNNCDTTFQLVLFGSNSILVLKVGDGIVAIKGDESIVIDENEDNFANETMSFGKSKPSDWIIKKIEKKKDVKYKSIICTDGIAGDLIVDNISEFIEEISKEDSIVIKKMLENWPNKSSNDDKTIVVVK